MSKMMESDATILAVARNTERKLEQSGFHGREAIERLPEMVAEIEQFVDLYPYDAPFKWNVDLDTTFRRTRILLDKIKHAHSGESE